MKKGLTAMQSGGTLTTDRQANVCPFGIRSFIWNIEKAQNTF